MDQNLRLLFTEMLRRTGRSRALYDGPEGMLLQTGGNGLFCGIPDAGALLRVLRGVTVPKDAERFRVFLFADCRSLKPLLRKPLSFTV